MFGLNILSSIPVVDENNNFIVKNEENKLAIESFNKLKSGIEFTGSNIKTILVSGVNDGEGKSTVVANLGCLYAKAGKKTLIVDADMHSGVQHTLFSLRNKVGLSNFLVDADAVDNLGEISAYIQATKEQNLFVMTYGIKPPNPTELLEDSAKLKETIDVLKLLYDVIVIDSASFKTSSECTLLGEVVDKTIIVVEENHTTKDTLLKLKDALEKNEAKISGIVFNKSNNVESEETEAETAVIEVEKVDEDVIEEPTTRIFATAEEDVEDIEENQESVEQLIDRLNKNKAKSEILVNTDEEEKEVIESNYINNSYNIEDVGEFKLQYNNIENELNNIKTIFEKVLVSSDERRKEAQITQNEISLLKDKLDDLKVICTSLNIAGNSDAAEKAKEEIARLETVFNASKDEDPEYVANITQRLDNMKELYFKTMDFENSVSAKTMEKIEDVKDLIDHLKDYINEKIVFSGRDEGIDSIKGEINDIENAYTEKLDSKLKALEESIIENINAKKNEDIKEYLDEMQEEYARDLDRRFLQLQDTIEQSSGRGEITDKIEEIKDVYYERLHDECMAIQECVVANSNRDKLERVLNEVQNINSVELADRINDMKDLLSGENIDFSNINGKLEDLKEYNSNEFREKLQSFYNLYSSDLDEGIDRLKEFQNEKFDNLKYYGDKLVDDLKAYEDENVNIVKDRIEEMEDRYTIELNARVEDMQKYYTESMNQYTEYNEEKFNDLKDKLDQLQDGYSNILDGKMADYKEHYTSKMEELNELNQDYFANKFDEMYELNKEQYSNRLDEMIEINQEQIDSLRDDLGKLQETLNTTITEVNQTQLDTLRDDIARIEEVCAGLNTSIAETSQAQIDTLSETSQAQLSELNDKVDAFEKRVIDLQKMQNQNCKSVEIKEVKEEISDLRNLYSKEIKAEFEGLLAKVESQNQELQAKVESQNQELQAKVESQNLDAAVATLRSDLVKLHKKIKATDTSIEDEIYNMKQELVKLRKEIENKPSASSFGSAPAPAPVSTSRRQSKMPANVYKYSDYEEVPEKKGLFGRRQPKAPDLNDAPAAASSISQILKF